MKGGRLLSRSSVWILRLTTGAVLLVSVAALALKRERAAGYARDRIEAAVAARSGRVVRVGSVAISLLPPGADIHDLVVAGAGDSIEEPLARVREASLSLSIEDLL